MTALSEPQLLHRFGRRTDRPMGDDDGVVTSNMPGWVDAFMMTP
jgi:hypothetical protein